MLYCTFSYIQYINQHMHSIKYNKIQITKHLRVDTFYKLYFMICTLLYFTERICWFLVVGPCHHGMARPQVANRGTASDKEGSCK